MFNNPITSLASAFYSALIKDLDDVVVNGVDFRGKKIKPHRPREDQVSVSAMFNQTWSSGALGFDDGRFASTCGFADAYTIIMQNTSMHDYAVYFGGEFAYKVPANPKPEFFEDIKSNQMVSVSLASARYTNK